MKKDTIASKILGFNDKLAKIQLTLPRGFAVINPYSGGNGQQIKDIASAFYYKFYNDNRKRKIVLGSSPARRGSAITGIPYEDVEYLQSEAGRFVNNFYVNKSSSEFLQEVIYRYGGREKFYNDFYMNFVCPLGIVRINPKGNEVNCNYYENKDLISCLYDFMIESIKDQMEFNIDSSVCYCIGSGENYKFLKAVNREYNLFGEIISLEHPRYIMQYNSKKVNYYYDKYLNAFHYGGR